ncbi:MAG: hypothetical protein NTX45_25470 [Proteobacteria bacterium]|nr:hypothetical protein [Pseudomonadota bacterium]
MANTTFYDRESQLPAVQAERPEQSEQFGYDPAGNRTQCNGDAAEFDAANRLLRQGGIRFLHDAHGDLAQCQSGGQAWRYTWNSRGQLVRAQSSDGRVVNAVRRNSVLAYCAEWPTLLLRRNTVEYRRFHHTALRL